MMQFLFVTTRARQCKNSSYQSLVDATTALVQDQTLGRHRNNCNTSQGIPKGQLRQSDRLAIVPASRVGGSICRLAIAFYTGITNG